MRSLVIGASSALGLAVVERLRREHEDVLCIVRPGTSQATLDQLGEWGAETLEGDATDPMLLPEALAYRGGREWVVVCAGGLCLSLGPEGAAARNFPGPLFENMAPLLAARLPERLVFAIPAAALAHGDTMARNDLYKLTDSHKRGLSQLEDPGLLARTQVMGMPPLIPSQGPLRHGDSATDTLRQLSSLPAEEKLVLLDVADAADRILQALRDESASEAIALGGLPISAAALKDALGHGIWARMRARFLPANKLAAALASHAASIDSGRAQSRWGIHHRDLQESLKAFAVLVGK